MSCDFAVRARDLGIGFAGRPGRFNAITDMCGVEVGYSTLWWGNGRFKVGDGPVRTGVTGVLTRGRGDHRPCFGGSFALNAGGEMTGLDWLEERGLFEGPILITHPHAVGVVRDATIQWMRLRGWRRLIDYSIPIVGKTYDGYFNDIDGEHVKAEHVFQSLDTAHGGVVEEGNIGGGTGMMSYGFKAGTGTGTGTGTASRRLPDEDGGYTVGVLVQANYGKRRQLRIAGIPMGEVLTDDMPRYLDPLMVPVEVRDKYRSWCPSPDGSIIVVVATDAPLLPHQLRRVAKRPALGIARLGRVGAALSGDLFVAFSTANPEIGEQMGEGGRPLDIAPRSVLMHPNLGLTELFEATVDATEEAILNAPVAADGAEGIYRLYVPRLPHERVRDILRTHNLLSDMKGGGRG